MPNNHQTESTGPARAGYAVVLQDEFDHWATTVHCFERSELWDWLQGDVEFPSGESAIRVDVPGLGEKRSITIGSAQNDKAHHIANDHPWAQQLHGIDSVDDYADRISQLQTEFGSDRVYEGLWY